MINNTTPGRWDRISAKNPDQQFASTMILGLNCSPFEAGLMVQKVHEIYGLWLDEADLKPGQVTVMAVDAAVPPSVPLQQATQRLVRVTLQDLTADVATRRRGGVPALRQARLARMAEEAFQQGGLLTLEDLSLLLNCGVRTLVNDLNALRREQLVPPLRSTVQDMGRAVTHRAMIIRCWLQGLEYSAIARACHHHVESVSRYVDKFKRCHLLLAMGLAPAEIARVIRVTPTLLEEFQALLAGAEVAPHRREELAQLEKKTLPGLAEVEP